ncbi:MAG: hypothetical protein PHQ74_15155, partial [Crocinitomicaceae bacterium]|nr:hypothetical protein [Crocinitomicaceae bacterium]
MLLDKFGNAIRSQALSQKNTGYNKKKPTDLIANIAQTFKDRSRKDVGKWRTAIQLAEHPTKPMRQPLM